MSKLTRQELLAAAEASEDATELHAMAKEHFDVTIHNRTGLEKSKAEVLTLIQGMPDAEGSADDTKPSAPKDPKPDKDPEPEPGKVRRLKNTRNGRIVAWNARLATRSHMEEV